MRKEDFAEILGDISENYIQEAETMKRSEKSVWVKWGAMAACFCLLAATAIPNLFSANTPIPPADSDLPIHEQPLQPSPSQSQEPQPAEDARTSWTIHFNEASSMLAADRAYSKATFTETLDAAELAVLKPNTALNCSGYARFDHSGSLLDIVLQTATTLPESPVTVGLASRDFRFDFVLSGDAVVSVCNELEYRVYQYGAGNTVTLYADTAINDICFTFSMEVPQTQLEQAKADFQSVLECFACYEEGKPDLSVIVPEEIPELTEQVFSTLSEAQAEPDFGGYMPSELPAGFGDAAISRFQFQDSNFLRASWSKGFDDLSWEVRPCTEDDVLRLTSVDDKENYDLSLYPIPRADSAPDELRKIVNNPVFAAEDLTLVAVYCRADKGNDAGDTEGCRMRFSVKYGDVIVLVSTRGVDPAWLYQQLMLLNME